MQDRNTDFGLAAAYGVMAAVALTLTRLDGGVAILWVANAALLVRLRGLPMARWPRPLVLCAVSNVAANIMFGASSLAAPGFAIANMCEACLATSLLNLWAPREELFETTRSVLKFTVVAGVIAPTFSGAIGGMIATLRLHRPLAVSWIDWTLGHGLGMLIVAPMAMLVANGDLVRWWRALDARSSRQTAAVLSLVTLVSLMVFGQDHLPILFLPALPVLVAAFQIGSVGAALSVLIVAVTGGGLTLMGHGPVTLIKSSHVLQMQFFQFYLASTFLLALPVAGALKHREQLLAALQVSEGRYRLLADNVTDAILSIAPDGAIRYASPAVRMLAGLDPQAMVGRNALELVHPDDLERVQAVHRQTLRSPGEVFTVDYRVTKADGEIGWFETRAKTMTDALGRTDGVVSAIREVSGRKQLEQQLREAAETDPLTGLANRRAFLHHLNASIATRKQGKPASLAMIDLDYFKRVNDEHGHGVGDMTLMLLADICRDFVRANDVVARIGGEEFALILNGAELAEAHLVCDRLREKIGACAVPIALGRSISISASIGVARVTPGASCDALLASADAALYQAKSAGRNRVVTAS